MAESCNSFNKDNLMFFKYVQFSGYLKNVFLFLMFKFRPQYHINSWIDMKTCQLFVCFYLFLYIYLKTTCGGFFVTLLKGIYKILFLQSLQHMKKKKNATNQEIIKLIYYLLGLLKVCMCSHLFAAILKIFEFYIFQFINIWNTTHFIWCDRKCDSEGLLTNLTGS